MVELWLCTRSGCIAALSFSSAIMPCSADPQNVSAWHLISIAQPSDATNVPALLHVADPIQSDHGLVGIMLVCEETGHRSALKFFVVVVEPMPPKAHPIISLDLTDPEQHYDFKGTVTSAGAAVTFDLEIQITQNWTDNQNLKIIVTNELTTVSGEVSLRGFSGGLKSLTSACHTP